MDMYSGADIALTIALENMDKPDSVIYQLVNDSLLKICYHE